MSPSFDLVLTPGGQAEGGVAEFAGRLSVALGGAVPSFVDRGVGGTVLVRAQLAALHPGAAVLVHYVNYGFARRGCPLVLVDRLADWRNARVDRRLVTLFHEVHASGPPWTSSFWLRPVQRALARRLARASDACVTSTRLYAEMLGQWVPAARVHRLPVFSTVGEPPALPPWEARRPELVVFGSAGVRARAYAERDAIERVVRNLGVTGVVDLGQPCGAPPSLAGRPVRAAGFLHEQELGERLLAARFAFLAYPPSLLDKSTVFAAYQAHGLCPLVAWAGEDPGEADGEGNHWLRAERLDPVTGDAAAAVGGRALERYSSYGLARHVALHRELLDPCAC